ncbi:MAG: ribosome maturation factor RimP [Ruminococcaceae bacterium]|nr:ribosome maturation factor RimP [Oscillospiraceae bacterium]
MLGKKENISMAKKDNIASRVKEAVKPIVEGAGYTLWDVTFYKEVSEWILEISIDKEEGISTDDCSVVTKLIDPIIDEMDPVEEAYCLMVSGAGGYRDLVLPMHYEYALARGCDAEVRTFTAVEGRKQFEGKLVSFDEETVTVLENGKELTFEKKQIAKITAICYTAAEEE